MIRRRCMRASLTEYGSVIRIYYTSKLFYIETYRVLTVLLHYSPIITVLKNSTHCQKLFNVSKHVRENMTHQGSKSDLKKSQNSLKILSLALYRNQDTKIST